MEPGAAQCEPRTDEQTIAACQKGDREAFRRLYEAHKDSVYSLALATLAGDRTAAEDVTQEVFVRLFTRIGQFRSQAEFTTWLYRLVINACRDEQRKRRRWRPFADVETVSAARQTHDEAAVRFAQCDSIRAALADLSPELRVTVLLKYYEELSYEEIAAILHCSQGTIASRLHRGLKILARKLSHLHGATLEE